MIVFICYQTCYADRNDTDKNTRKVDSRDQLSFMGSKADPSVAAQNALPANIGPKVCIQFMVVYEDFNYWVVKSMFIF